MLSPISIQTFEFNDQGFVIKVKDNKVYITKDGKDEGVYFNCLYNKAEIDSLISTGVDEDHLRNVLLTAINTVLKAMTIYNSLQYNSLDKVVNINTKNIERSTNAIFEMFQWTNSSLSSIGESINDAFDWLRNIKECHCGDPGGFNETISKQVNDNSDQILMLENFVLPLRNDCSYLQTIILSNRNKFLLYPATQTVSCLYTNAVNSFKNTLHETYTPINENEYTECRASQYPLVNPDTEIDNIDISVIDDPQHRTFDENKPVYGTLTLPFDLQVNGVINGSSPGPGPEPSESDFNHVDGYEYYYVKNDDIETTDETYHDVTCTQLTIIGFPLTTLSKIKQLDNRTNVLRIVLRKNEILDESGAFIKDFYIYVENKRLYCPVITVHSEEPLQHIVYHEVADVPYVAFDKQVNFNPYTLYLNGELSIMNLLCQQTIEAKIPEIKCDIITARNAFKLHESNVPYLYKPSYINETADHYSMTFQIPDTYSIPTNMDITFKEYCFKNTWVMTWDGTRWLGNNIQGRSNDCKADLVINKYEECFVTIGYKKNDFNTYICSKWLNKTSFSSIINLSTIKISGTFDNGDDFTVARGSFQPLSELLEFGGTYKVTDLTPDTYELTKIAIRLKITKHDHTKNQLIEHYISHITSVNMDIIIKDIPNRFTFTLSNNSALEEFTTDSSGYYLFLKPHTDAIEYLNIHVEDSNIDTSTKDVTLYLDRKSVRPIEEINWDPKTNPFKFIIDQQFYEITPNPNAATTLYTDYNITSSKIITADNITTMRSDLNIVANTQDVMVYDFDKLSHKVDNMDAELKNVENVVQHIQKDVKTLKIEAGFALAFGIAGTVMGGAALTMSAKALKIGWESASSIISGEIETAEGSSTTWVDVLTEDSLENITDVFSESLSDINSLSNTTTAYDQLKIWIQSEHVAPKYSPKYASTEDNEYNPKHMLVTYNVVQEVGMHYRDSLKPLFNAICNQISREEIKINDTVTALDTRPSYTEFGVYADGEASANGMVITFNEQPYEGTMNIDVRATDSVRGMELTASVTIKYEKGVLTEFKGQDESSTSAIVTGGFKPVTDGKTLTITTTLDGGTWTCFVIVYSLDLKCFTYKGVQEIVYKDMLNSYDNRLQSLESKHSTSDNSALEARVAALEHKCKNIMLEETTTQTLEQSTNMSLEQRVAVLEHKLRNIE